MNDIKIDYICSCQGRLTETLASTPAPQRGTRSFLFSFSPSKTISLNATMLSLQSYQYHPLHPYTLSLYTQNLHFCSFLLNFGNVEVNFGEVKITVVLGAWRKNVSQVQAMRRAAVRSECLNHAGHGVMMWSTLWWAPLPLWSLWSFWWCRWWPRWILSLPRSSSRHRSPLLRRKVLLGAGSS